MVHGVMNYHTEAERYGYEGFPNRWIAGGTTLDTACPVIAAEAYGWDPTGAKLGSDRVKEWLCPNGHIWETSIINRTHYGYACLYCVRRRVLAGYNDLQTTHPTIAAEAHGWNPTTVLAGAAKKLNWLCDTCGTQWEATPARRTSPTPAICPNCPHPSGGYKTYKQGSLYLIHSTIIKPPNLPHIHRPALEFGISNTLQVRLNRHRRYGFTTPPIITLNYTDGGDALTKENTLIALMKLHHIPTCTRDGVVFPGSTEAFFTDRMTPEFITEFLQALGLTHPAW